MCIGLNKNIQEYLEGTANWAKHMKSLKIVQAECQLCELEDEAPTHLLYNCYALKYPCAQYQDIYEIDEGE